MENTNSTSTDVRAEASAWIAQLETGDLTRADIEAFREWVQRSPRHGKEIRALAQMSAELNSLTDLAGPLRSAAKHYQGVVEYKNSRWPSRTLWLAPLAIALLFVGFLVNRPSAVDPVQNLPRIIATEIGEYHKQVLPDGSTVALNTNSQLEIEYTRTRRSVRLLRGEVLFTVMKNPDRPFVVYVGDKFIEALGTAFVVRLEADSFELAVTEGNVRLAQLKESGIDTDLSAEGDHNPTADTRYSVGIKSQAGAATAPIVLQAGQRISVQAHNTKLEDTILEVKAVTAVELRRKLAWQEGLLDFSDTPLEMVIREVSRHTTLKIKIADPELRKLKFGGMFRTGDVTPLFKALESAYDIRAIHTDPDTVQLTRSKES